jgi:hypothetical protein
MTWLKWIGLLFVALLIVTLSAAIYGSWRWREATKARLVRLENNRSSIGSARFDERELEGLPSPVKRYFRAALKNGQPIITAVTMQHRGTFNMSESAEAWKPFTSNQRVITRRPGFDWDARIMLMMGVPIYVNDAYIAGEGILRGAVFGVIPVVKMASTPEMARGELMRFFAEAAWYPTALLPSQGVRWQAIDESAASATLTDGDITLTLTIQFGKDAMIESVRADARGRVVDGKTISAPWQGRFWQYENRGGIRIPIEGEVAWLLPSGTKPYWRGTTISYAPEYIK